MADHPPAEQPLRRVKSVTNAVRLLEVLKAAPEPLRLSEISTQLGLRKSTVHLLLMTLSDFNFVQPHGPHGHYRLGLGVFEVGAAALDRLNLPPELSPLMGWLADRSMEAVSLAVKNGSSALIVRRYESAHILRAEIGLGTRMPLHASASGKVLLAGLTREQIDQLYPAEQLPEDGFPRANTKTTLLRELEKIKRDGFTTATDEFTPGVAAIAAPVLDRDGQTVAALSIAGPTNRFERAKWITDLLNTAEKMSALLGLRERSMS